MHLHKVIKRPTSATNCTMLRFFASKLQNDWILHLGWQCAWTLKILASILISVERTMRGITTPAVGCEHNRGSLKRLCLSVPSPVFLQYKCPERGRCRPDPTITCVYNFGTLSLFCGNSSSRPALCFVLSEQTETCNLVKWRHPNWFLIIGVYLFGTNLTP